MNTRREGRSNLCNFVSSLSHLSCFITSSWVLYSLQWPKRSVLKLLASSVIARLCVPRSKAKDVICFKPKEPFQLNSSLFRSSYGNGPAPNKLPVQCGERFMEEVMGQAGGGKTMHQRCELRVLGAQRKRRLFIIKRYHWGNTWRPRWNLWWNLNESDFNQWSKCGQNGNSKLRNSSKYPRTCSEVTSGLFGLNIQVKRDKAGKKRRD